jgi:hypothetical protein
VKNDTVPIVAVRLGPVDETGAYFSLPGSSAYFNPVDIKRDCYDLSDVRILDWRDPLLAMALLTKTLALATPDNATARGIALLQAGIEELEQGEAAHVDYFMADETPMASATKSLGFGALLIFENDDWVSPSSVFVTDAAISNVRKLTPKQRAEFLRRQSLADVNEASLPDPTQGKEVGR